MCKYKDDFSHMILMEYPKHMNQYKNNRIKAGLSGKCCIDECIVDDIKKLWDKEIITHGSCCGHGKQESYVNVADESIQKMIDMGYVMNHHDKTRRDTFKLI